MVAPNDPRRVKSNAISLVSCRSRDLFKKNVHGFIIFLNLFKGNMRNWEALYIGHWSIITIEFGKKLFQSNEYE
jgi:hypothetical protein